MELPYNQDALIEALAAANPNLVVINISGTGVAMPWVKKVPAILQAWYLGNETGNALASILVGDANPSGKLPYTYYASLDQCGAHKLGEYPGHKGVGALGEEVWDMPYNEGIFVGYRFTDKNKLKPTFPFGHGLSYTTFEYGKPTADAKSMTADGTLTVKVTVKNTGAVAGKEIVQLYISDKKASVARPVKELKGFQKVFLAPGEEKEVAFTINKEALSFFDAEAHDWKAEPGKFEAIIGASATDIKGVVPFTLAE